MAIPIFPALQGLTWPVVKVPTWRTLSQMAHSGKDTPLAAWSYPRVNFQLTFEFLKADAVAQDQQTLQAFYNACFGRTNIFAFQDQTDYAVAAQPFGLGNGTTDRFQLVQETGGFSMPVYATIGTPQIFIDGTPTAEFTMDAGGQVDFLVAPPSGATLTWTGNFYHLCRFDDDTVEFSFFMRNFAEVKKLSFTSVKL